MCMRFKSKVWHYSYTHNIYKVCYLLINTKYKKLYPDKLFSVNNREPHNKMRFLGDVIKKI